MATEQQLLPGVPPGENGGLKSLSASKIQTFLRCGAAYFFRYSLGLRSPPRGAQILGTAVHSGLEKNFRQKIQSQLDLPLAEITEFYSASFDFLKATVQWEKGEDSGKLKDDGVKMLQAYNPIAQTIKPKEVEAPFSVALGGVPYVLKGFVDLLDESALIVDFKTTGRAPSAIEAHKSLQLTTYSLAHRLRTGQVESGLRLDYLIRGKTPKIVQIQTARTNEDLERFLKLIGIVAASISEERFLPNPTSPWCGPRYCEFWDRCEGGRRFG